MGLSAISTPGAFTICHTPSTPSTANHSNMTGPNSRPTPAVPRDCSMNSATRMTSDIGTT